MDMIFTKTKESKTRLDEKCLTIPEVANAFGLLGDSLDPAETPEPPIFFCGRSVQGQKEFAVIERFRSDSAFTQSCGDADVLLASDEPVVLVQDYAANAHQALRFIASNRSPKPTRSFGNVLPVQAQAESSRRIPNNVLRPRPWTITTVKIKTDHGFSSPFQRGQLIVIALCEQFFQIRLDLGNRGTVEASSNGTHLVFFARPHLRR